MHGTCPNRVYDLAIQNNITPVEQELYTDMYRSDHTPVDKDLLDELMEYGFEVLEDPPEDPEPVGKFVTRK